MGRCNEANFVGFDVSAPAFVGSENACAREVESLEDECSLAFGWERFSGELYAGTSGTVSPAASFDGDDYVQVNGGSVLLLTVGSEVINRGQGHYIHESNAQSFGSYELLQGLFYIQEKCAKYRNGLHVACSDGV